MPADLITTLIAIAGLCLGTAILIAHTLAKQTLAIAGTVLFGVVLVVSLLPT